jgi:dihydrofolate reductase
VLVYSAIASLDGYVVDASGSFDWAAPDEEVHAAVNDAERGIGTYLYGRRMYEVMTFWETADDDDPVMRDYAAIWQAADKVVYSTTLPAVTTARTRLERAFDPDAVRALAADGVVSIGGPTLAAHALRAGLVDECHLYVVPEVVGGGTPWLPDDVRISLDLLDVRRFASGVVHLSYGVRANTSDE